MVADQLRYAEKFISGDGVTVTFPLNQYEYQSEQDYRVNDQEVVGADYAFDFAGTAEWAKNVAVESVRFLLVKATPLVLSGSFDAIVAGCRNGGLGALWTVDAAGNRRWAWAKLDSRPGYVSSVELWQHTAVTLRFRRYSDWMAENAVSVQATITTTSQSFTVTNDGNAPVENMVILFEPLNATGFNQPKIENLMNGAIVGTTRVAGATTQRARFDTERYLLQWSTNSGASYADDYGNIVLGTKQVAFMRLEPGANTIRVTNLATPNMRVTITFSPTFH